MSNSNDTNAISIEHTPNGTIIRDHTGSVISASGYIIDETTGTRIPGNFLGPVGNGFDLYVRYDSADGLTLRDRLAAG